MALIFTIFIKRPRYALGFIPLLLLMVIGSLKGNSFTSLMTFIFSSISWSIASIVLYLSDKKVNANLLGVDLKEYCVLCKLVLICQGIFLSIIWMVLIGKNISILDLPNFLSLIFIPNFLIFLVGGWMLLGSLAIKISKTDAKLNEPTVDRLIEDIKNLISQN